MICRAYRMLLPVLVAIGLTNRVQAQVPLVTEGTARAAIYLATPTEYAALKPAVDDLQRAIEKMSGAKLPIVITNAPGLKRGPYPILIGQLAEKEVGRPRVQSRFHQGWRLTVSKKRAGISGETDEGVHYAIYELLDQLGCRWYMPSDWGEVIPATPTVTARIQDVSAVPATIYRNVWYADNDFKRRNRLGGLYLAAGHAIGGDVCRSDPAAAHRIATGIVAALDAKYTASVSLSPDDTIQFCQCDRCKALDAGDWDTSMNCASLSDRMVHFGNTIVGEVNRKYPDVLFGMLAYVQYTRPTLREKPLPNLVPQIAPITYCRAHSMVNTNCPSRPALKPIVEGWGRTARNLSMYHYAYNLAEVSCPYPMLTLWSEELPICYSNHLTFWMPETMPNFESALPGLYLGIRMAWYTQSRPHDILDEFFRNFYGAAADPMRTYWQTIDDAWTRVPEHAGCGFGHLRRFPPATLQTARTALDQAATACVTPMEKQRVQLADDSFHEFELFMKLRRDLVAGRLVDLATDAATWVATWDRLMAAYSAQYAFSPYAKTYFCSFFQSTYQDGARIAREYVTLPPLRAWHYRIDPEKAGERLGWHKPEFDDTRWKTTDPGVDSWSALGVPEGYYGPLWYRASTVIPAVPPGKKIYLWIGATDGSARLFVNGQALPYEDAKGQKADAFAGYCAPASFDVTAAVKPGELNRFAIRGTHDTLNELGTGGLLGPVLVYHEKP